VRLHRGAAAAGAAALLAAPCLAATRDSIEADRLQRRACAYLWASQAADGGWHSETHGLFRSGQALTPFILHALTGAPAHVCRPPSGGVARALAFLRLHVSGDGLLGAADEDVLEYPNYATAYGLRCFVRAGSAADAALIRKMRRKLVTEQYTPENGFPAASLAFGGWGFGGRRSAGKPGHMDIAHTRRVLQALREAGTQDSVLFERAQTFLRLMQRHPSERRPQPVPHTLIGNVPALARFDGGFYFSPVVLDANKGAVGLDERGAFHASYATATCDGLLALLAAGVPREDERVRAAVDWLARHARLDHPEGIPTGTPQNWGEAVYYYHLAVRAEVDAALGRSGASRSRIADELRPRQRENGSFANDRNHLMKEDDPLLATALAVLALEPPRSH
jgi:squalene-hopene/tetraprenyl-beta-curcumene cyclase